MVWESGRRCQWAIRDWWLSSKAITVLAAAREDGLAIVKRTWEQPRRGTVAISGIWTRAWVWSPLHAALAMKSCAKMPLPWNLAVTSELGILLESRQPPSALKKGCEPLCVSLRITLILQASNNPAAFLGYSRCCLDPELSGLWGIMWTERPVAFQSWRGWLQFCACAAGLRKGQARTLWLK